MRKQCFGAIITLRAPQDSVAGRQPLLRVGVELKVTPKRSAPTSRDRCLCNTDPPKHLGAQPAPRHWHRCQRSSHVSCCAVPASRLGFTSTLLPRRATECAGLHAAQHPPGTLQAMLPMYKSYNTARGCASLQPGLSNSDRFYLEPWTPRAPLLAWPSDTSHEAACVCLHVCVFMCVHTRVAICTHVTCAHIHTRAHTCICIYVHSSVRSCVLVCASTCVHVCACSRPLPGLCHDTSQE